LPSQAAPKSSYSRSFFPNASMAMEQKSFGNRNARAAVHCVRDCAAVASSLDGMSGEEDGQSGLMGRVPVRGLGFSARPNCRGFVFLYSFSLFTLFSSTILREISSLGTFNNFVTAMFDHANRVPVMGSEGFFTLKRKCLSHNYNR
jgi:hypothetical protein